MVRRDTGSGKVDPLPLVPSKGFNRLPMPDSGDLFFDMEGDPFIADGLEYLFGFVLRVNDEERFVPFWAHGRLEEKAAFEGAIDFIVARLLAYPKAHIYHYNHYEETALKRLAMYHGTRESEVDDLLRQGRLVDLYKVVRESVRTSEPGYSIKNLETFYLKAAREGNVKSAGDSIVAYENWRSTQDPLFFAANRLLQPSRLSLDPTVPGLASDVKAGKCYVAPGGGGGSSDAGKASGTPRRGITD